MSHRPKRAHAAGEKISRGLLIHGIEDVISVMIEGVVDRRLDTSCKGSDEIH